MNVQDSKFLAHLILAGARAIARVNFEFGTSRGDPWIVHSTPCPSHLPDLQWVGYIMLSESYCIGEK